MRKASYVVIAFLAVSLSAGAQQYGPGLFELNWPSFQELEERLQGWEQKHPQWAKLETLAKSAEGRAVYCMKLTDKAVPDDDKEHVLLTAAHTGWELPGGGSLFYVMKWLLSGDPRAREILRRQVLLCIPVVNPDGWANRTKTNSLGMDPDHDWSFDGPKEPEKMPESMAVKRMLDQYQPELHVDFHGTSAIENVSPTNLAALPYHFSIMRLMAEAGLEGGYPTLQFEDEERTLWGPALDPIREKFSSRRGQLNNNRVYGYTHFHTIVMETHSAWQESSLLRHRRLLEIGNQVWPGEYYPGYPVRVIGINLFHMVTAYGETVAQRRRSRVELWNKQRQITHGLPNPLTAQDGMAAQVCATSPAAAEKWLADDTLAGFASRISDHPKMNGGEIRNFFEGHPDDRGRPATLALERGAAKVEESSPIEHGLALRLRLPYAKAKLVDLRLNGHSIDPSKTDGYLTWVARGFTYVQANIPPERTKAEDLFIVTCRYDPGETRTQGEGW